MYSFCRPRTRPIRRAIGSFYKYGQLQLLARHSHFQVRYAYRPLPTTTSIRVIEFHSLDQVEEEDLLSFSTSTIDLADNPHYGALSYTWGRPISVFETIEERDRVEPGDRLIRCDGQLVGVTQNLHDFLLEWRRSRLLAANPYNQLTMALREGGLLAPSKLWVDAICINQSDLSEKTAQISIMGRIYSQAHKVVIWLGPMDSFTRPAFELMKKIGHVTLEQARALRSSTTSDTCHALGLPPIHDSSWWSVYALFQRNWFRRVWILQELAFARESYVQIGAILLSWKDLVKICGILWFSGLGRAMEEAAWIEISGSQIDQILVKTTGSLVIQHSPRPESDRRLFHTMDINSASFINVFDIERFRIGNGSQLTRSERSNVVSLSSRSHDVTTIPPVTLLSMLERASKGLASDPRDMAYALIDLAKRDVQDSGNVSLLRKPLVADYRQSVDDVFLQVAWHVLLSNNCLDLLQYRSLDVHEPYTHMKAKNLPSWVPDWTSRVKNPLWTKKALCESIWDSSAGLEWTPASDLPVYGRQLGITGLLVDTVSDVATSKQFSLSKSGQLACDLPRAYPWTPPGSTETPDRVLWKTLIAGHDDVGYPARDFSQVFHWYWVDTMMRAKSSLEMLSLGETEECMRLESLTDILFPQWKGIRYGRPAEEKHEHPVEEMFGAAHQVDKIARSLAERLTKMSSLGNEQLTKHSGSPGEQAEPSQAPATIRGTKFAEENDDQESTHQHTKMFDTIESLNASMREARPKRKGHVALGDSVQNTDEEQLNGFFTDARELGELMEIFNGVRRVFRTQQNYLGNGPGAARPGDQVWVLAGGRVPFVLRPQEEKGKFELVGDAYVHGIMHGEAVSQTDGKMEAITLV
ncbi:hypothetical protein CDV31_008391 [Fusarium ambrosium]|uniref:Heterokaryon incompatibility domain-containing protein n=1 Tax=Fusarium ambrosium TaxID=131363 RepID=A0A428U0S9_9HYPO|nr:hypothetical protein CDV31_008391 [Fusarium ambrosium]